MELNNRALPLQYNNAPLKDDDCYYISFVLILDV